jgi:thiamine biosynthesis protein ThiS
MKIVINGEKHEAPEGVTVLGLVESLGLDPGQLAIELDGLILKRQDWSTRVLAEGARLEVVHFVGGG